MSSALDFYTLDSWMSSKHKNYLIVQSFTSNGDTHNYISEIKSITAVHDYIVSKFKDKTKNIKSRKISVTLDNDKVMHVLQNTVYDSYTSFKLYKIYASEDKITRLKKLIYDTDFKS
jgi:hypothetical protein